MKKLWQKNWELNQLIETFETAGDLVLDQKLVKYDVIGSLAHARGLNIIGIISTAELDLLKNGLSEIINLNDDNKFNLQPGDEDVHTKIENHLTEQLGEVGKKIHTGRSRNDQVLTTIRLFTKENLLQVWTEVLELAEAFLVLAEENKNVLMPGYTHMQRAMPSSIGMWAGSFAEGLLDDLKLLKTTYQLNDQSPLGSAAGYGVPLNLDRQFVSDALGFAKVQNNSLYCQNSRGKIEGVVLASLITILQDINKFATDVLLFTTAEFGFLEVSSELCSGSSIMPQKKNVDLAELLRSKVHVLLGNYVQLISLSSNLVSGYNRDLQDSKKPLFESLELTVSCLSVAKMLVLGLKVNQKNIIVKITPEIFATHIALELVKKGIPFREAYRMAAKEYNQTAIPTDGINQSQHLGGTGNLGIGVLKKQLLTETEKCDQEKNAYQSSIKKLFL